MRHSKSSSIRSLSFVALGALAAACAPSGAEPGASRRPVVGGALDETHTAVGAIIAQGMGPICSGVLIAPRAVLTAAFCLDDVGVQVTDLSLFFGTTWTDGAATIAVTAGLKHPDHVMSGTGAPAHISAILTLAEDAPVAPLPWLSTPLPDITSQTITAVGYGVTNAQTQAGGGTRRQVDMTVSSIDVNHVLASAANAGTCMGDAGGPALMTIGGQVTMVALASFGDQSCVVQSGFNRLDVDADFILAHTSTPFTVSITAPADGAIVPSTFTVSVTADSPAGLESLAVELDGALAGTITAAPWELELADVPDGTHSVSVTAIAEDGAIATDAVTVTVASASPQEDGGVDAGGGGGGGGASSGGCQAGRGPAGGLGLLALLGLALGGARRRS
jgi:hypothetical protein